MGNTTSSAVEQCLTTALGGNKALLATPATVGYQISHVKPYNLDIPVNPTAVTYPQTSAQVAAVVKCAVANALKVQPRCGGHSYANYGMKVLRREDRVANEGHRYWWAGWCYRR